MSGQKCGRPCAESDGQRWQDLQAGHAASNVGEDTGEEYYAAMLYLPNPGSRTGWECHGVERRPSPTPAKPLGFRGVK